MRIQILVSLAGCLFLTACATSSLPKINSIDVNSVSAVQAEIKRQVGVYAKAAAADRAQRRANPPDAADYWCGANGLDFEISSVKIDLLTSTDTVTKENAGITVPISAFSLAVTPSHSYDATNVQELVYNEWVASAGDAPDATLMAKLADHPKPAPIANILLALRAGLIEASKKAPANKPPNGPQACFTAYNQIPSKAADDPGDTIKISFSAVSDDAAGVTLSLGIASLGANIDSKVSGSSTLTASFREVGSTAFKACKDDPTRVCEADAKTRHGKSDNYDLHIMLNPPAIPQTAPPG